MKMIPSIFIEMRLRCNTNPFDVFPSVLELWELFWPLDLLCKIVCETNRYARMVIDPLGNTMEGPRQESLTLAIHIYMGLRKQSNIPSYWHKEVSIFHCPMISRIMTTAQFWELRRCMHITNSEPFRHIQRRDLGYDKMRQVQWLVNNI